MQSTPNMYMPAPLNALQQAGRRYGVSIDHLPPIETLRAENLKDFSKEDLRCYLEASGIIKFAPNFVVVCERICVIVVYSLCPILSSLTTYCFGVLVIMPVQTPSHLLHAVCCSVLRLTYNMVRAVS